MRSILPLFALAIAVSGPALATELVPVPPFRSVQLRGGGAVMLRPGRAQLVTIVEGSARITRFSVERDGQLRIDVCNGHCPRKYRLRVEIQGPYVPDVAISGGGLIQASNGFAPQRQLSAAVRGGGKVDVAAVTANSVSAAVHGGGLISVHPRLSLAAVVNGGGEIRYSGNPQVSSAINGGGAVRRVN